MIGEIPQRFPFPEYEDITRAAVINTCIKIQQYFRDHDAIQISVSGGSDSDCIVHLICKYFPEYIEKCYFVFVNTGLEYAATKRHLCDLERKYGIRIDRIRGQSVVTSVKEWGVPILSKAKSKEIRNYLLGQPYAIKRVTELKGRYGYTDGQLAMIAYIKENGIKVSDMCCTKSKKAPLKRYAKQHHIDLTVTGERRAEGGQRASSHKSCFECQKHAHKFMPLFWWTDYEKADFKAKEGIRYSDCYEVYGMRRTGCVGCPFDQHIADDLQAMYEYEPKLFKVCMRVFGQSYELMDRFGCRMRKCLPDGFQMTLTEEIERNEGC